MDEIFSFGNWIRRQRKVLDLTQATLAQQVGCAVVTIKKIEREERRPSLQMANLLADCLSISEADRNKFIRMARGQHVPSPPAIAVPAPPLPARRTAPPNKLPAQTTPFVGREAELADIAALIADPTCRLLTLVGVGGIGKSRLSIEAARGAGFPHGVYFVPLAPLASADPLVSTIADSVGLVLHGSNDPKQQLFGYLHNQELLLVLDNFEHLLVSSTDAEEADNQAGTALVTELLQHAPHVKLLVTSRERLNLQAEWIYSVEGLTVPTNGQAKGVEGFSAPRLFLQQAHRINRNFGQQPEEWPYISRICRLVGGSPLAIELAAAWTRVLSCHEIVREIERSLDFLATSMRDLPERHRNMRAVFDYSWGMLTAQEQRLFQRLSVCRGGFTRAAAEAIAGEVEWYDDDLQMTDLGQLQLIHRQFEVLDALTGLVDKSFLRHTSTGRYEAHELMRQYGASRLKMYPEDEARTRNRHAAYYVYLLAYQEPRMKGSGQRSAFATVGQEFENIKLGWQRAAEHGEATLLLKACLAFFLFYTQRGLFAEFRDVTAHTGGLMEQFFQRNTEKAQGYRLVHSIMLVLWAATASLRLGHYREGLTRIDRAISALHRLKAYRWLAFALNMKGAIFQLLGDYERARQCFVESIEFSRKVADRWLEGYSLNDLGLMMHLHGKDPEAQRLSQQSLDIFTEIDDRRGKAFALNNLGLYAFQQGDYAEADWLYREGVKYRQINNNQWGVATGLIQLGLVATARAEPETAYRYLLEAVQTAQDVRAIPLLLDALVELAILQADTGATTPAEDILQLALRHPALAKPAREKAGQHLAALRGVAKPLPTAQLPEDEAARELDALVAMVLSN